MNSSGSWELEIDPDFFKQLRRIPKDYSRHILEVVEDLRQNPFAGDIQKMKDDKDTWRRRVGVYRIFYEIFPDEKAIRVFHVERRTSKTY